MSGRKAKKVRKAVRNEVQRQHALREAYLQRLPLWRRILRVVRNWRRQTV
jgi:uncharacterized protein YnzC (UPF0291/DUF896 family)